MNRSAGLFAVSLIGALHSGTARADAASESVATALFEQAREDMRKGDVAAACPKFAESQRIDPSNGTLLNLILCEEKLGKIASAWTHSKELVDSLPLKDDRRPIAERRLAALSTRVPKLVVRLSPDAPTSAKVLLDGVELGASSLGIPIPVDPGTHRLTVSAEGRADRTTELSIRESSVQEWVGEPGPVEPPPSRTTVDLRTKNDATPPPRAEAKPPPLSPAADATRIESSAPPKWLGWTATGIGSAALVAGAAMGVMALDRKATVEDVCPNKQCRDQSGIDAADQGKILVVGAIIGLAVGAVGLGVGIFVLTRGSPTKAHAATSSFAPSAAGLTLTRTF